MTMSHSHSPETSGREFVGHQEIRSSHDIAEATLTSTRANLLEATPPQGAQNQHQHHHKQQVIRRKTFTYSERIILTEINKCFVNWYAPWHRCYLEDGPKFSAVHDLMEGLLHYEQQIEQCDTGLPEERVTAIAKAVARLIDYGNAILDIDITIRTSDDSFLELDPLSMTTVELYRAHLGAQKLRDKLLQNYFKRAHKQQTAASQSQQASDAESPTNGSPSFTHSSSLRLPHSASSTWSFPSPTLDRSQRFSIGSSSSINTLGGHRASDGASSHQSHSPSEGRRTPQLPPPLLPSTSASFIEVRTTSPSMEDLTESQLEMRHMLATLRSEAFSNLHNAATRRTLLQAALAKVESLLLMASDPEKLSHCFELLDTLLDVLERMPAEARQEEISLVARSILMTLVRKVHLVGNTCSEPLDYQRAHWTTYLLALMRMMSAADFGHYLKSFSPGDLKAFLTEYLFIIERLVVSSFQEDSCSPTAATAATTTSVVNSRDDMGGPVYPRCWLEMGLLMCSALLKSLIYLYQVLRAHFNSNTHMWQSYFECLVRFVLQEPLQLQRPMLKSRQVLLADDLRKTSAEYVWIAWDSLEVHLKEALLEGLAEPLLRACMSLGPRHRSILLPIFYNMMQCDYTSQYLCSTGPGGQQLTSMASAAFDYNAADPTCRFYEEDFEAELAARAQRRSSASSSTAGLPHPAAALELASPAENDLDFLTSGLGVPPGPNPDESLPYLSLRNDQNSSGGSQARVGSINKSSGASNCANNDSTVLTRFTHLIIGKLNGLMIDRKLGDELFKHELCSAIAGDLNPKYHLQAAAAAAATQSSPQGFHHQSLHNSAADVERFRAMARHTANLVNEFMQICLDSRQAERFAYNHLHLLCLFKLIMFFRDKVDVVGLYSANLHKLWCIHNTAGRFAEAGFTLLEHAKSLEWSARPLEKHHLTIAKSFQAPEALTDHMNLKQVLYVTIIEYFDQSQLWELAVPLCRELCDIYQRKLFDYVRLAQVHAKLATFFANIAQGRQLRSQPEYFRVGFFGCGFPVSLQNCAMIYRGRPFEKLGDFQATLLSKYPDAQLLRTLAAPERALLSKPGAKYLQINACSPLVDLPAKLQRSISCTSSSGGGGGERGGTWSPPPLNTTTNTATTSAGGLPPVGELQDYIVAYYKHNECDKFEYSRRIAPPANRNDKSTARASSSAAASGDDFANMWRQRITLTTNTLPGMLHFFPVFLTETATISPLECAIEDLERANDRLFCMLNRFRADKRQEEDVRALGQLLLGLVDAAVNGGIRKYEQAFFESEPTLDTQQQHQGKQTNNTNNTSQLEQLKGLIARQVPLLDEAIGFHRERVADVMRPQHEHLECAFKKLKQHVMSKYARYLPAEYNRRQQRHRNNSTSSRSHLLAGGGSGGGGAGGIARSPSRSSRTEARYGSRLSAKRHSDESSGGGMGASSTLQTAPSTSRRAAHNGRSEEDAEPVPSLLSATTNIPYRQLGSERRSLPFLAGVRNLNLGSPASAGGDQSSAAAEFPSSGGNIYTTIKYEKIPDGGGGGGGGGGGDCVPPLPPPRSRVSSMGQPGDTTATTRNDSIYVSLPDARRLLHPTTSNDNPYTRLLAPEQDPHHGGDGTGRANNS